MSPKNRHMDYRVKGVRGGVRKFSIERLKRQLKGINSWEEFLDKAQDNQLYGNTNLTDLPIIAGYYKNGLRYADTAEDIGYAMHIRPNGQVTATQALRFRLKRMNVASPFLIIEAFIDQGLIPRHTITDVLRIKGGFTHSERLTRRSKYFNYYAKWYITSLLEYIGEQPEYVVRPHLAVAAEITETDGDTIRYWYELEVEDVMVKPS